MHCFVLFTLLFEINSSNHYWIVIHFWITYGWFDDDANVVAILHNASLALIQANLPPSSRWRTTKNHLGWSIVDLALMDWLHSPSKMNGLNEGHRVATFSPPTISWRPRTKRALTTQQNTTINLLVRNKLDYKALWGTTCSLWHQFYVALRNVNHLRVICDHDYDYTLSCHSYNQTPPSTPPWF